MALEDLLPSVAILDGDLSDTAEEGLRGIANIFKNASSSVLTINEQVYEKAFGIFVWSMMLNADELRKFKKLKIIVKLGDDVDNIDVETCGELGIAVCIVPEYYIDDVANAAICEILNIYKGIPRLANAFASGQDVHNVVEMEITAPTIKQSTLGIVGLGLTGRDVAIRAKALGFKVIFYDPNVPEGSYEEEDLVRMNTLKDLLNISHCVTLHWAGSSRNTGLMDEDAIMEMRPGSFLISVGRGQHVDTRALIVALKSCHIGAAVLPESALGEGDQNDCPNLILTKRAERCDVRSIKEMQDSAVFEMSVAVNGNIPGSLLCCINVEHL